MTAVVPLRDALCFPFPEPPAPGGIIEVADGLLWLRLPLPLRLDHVNVYLLRDGDGYVVVDCGMSDDVTKAIWDGLITGLLRDTPITRVLVTHYHPDHIGAAGWLVKRTGAPLMMGETEYLLGLLRVSGLHEQTRAHDQQFFEKRGLDPDVADEFLNRGEMYTRTVAPLPFAYERLRPGTTITIGARRFAVLTGGGHSEDQVMLYCAEDEIFLCADQVIAGITPNIAVWPMEPDASPLDMFLESLQQIKQTVPDEVLVLPGHKLPFFGLHRRIDELQSHHDEVCDRIVGFCEAGPLNAAELVPMIFKRRFNAHHMVLAFAETLAHMHRLLKAGRLIRAESASGVLCVTLP
jgi:glyoxylase-like metal-dependent hydrolase (beta-lactamase superfamily II)